MKALFSLAVLALVSAGGSAAATLEKLSFEEMAQKSTEVVRGRVVDSSVSAHSSLLFTEFRVEVLERWKGEESQYLTVSVPGGSKAGIRQSFSGAPRLSPGSDYVFFLWTGKSGVTQIIGLSQGLFDVTVDSAGGKPEATRAAAKETMVNSATGQRIQDTGLRLSLDELRMRVRQALGGQARP